MHAVDSPSYSLAEQAQHTPAATKGSRTVYPQLTGIRAVAAYLVFAHHYSPFPVQSWGERILREFHIGVAIFFVLSGFLIALRYSDKVELQRAWLFRYFKNRFARIYPVFFLLTWLYYLPVFFNSANRNIIFEFLANLLLVKAFFKKITLTGVGQAWSLTVEECFYALAPVVFWLHRRYGKWVFGMPVLLLAIGFGLVVVAGGRVPLGFFVDAPFMLARTFFGRCVEFFVGIALAYAFLSGRSFSVKYLTWWGLAGMAMCVWGLVNVQRGTMQGFESYPGICINNFVLPFAIACLFWGLLTERTWLAQLLSTRPLVLLGKSSYVFYLIHIGTINAFLEDNIPNNWVLHFLLLNVVAIAIYYFVEEPLNKYLRKSR